MCLIGFSPLDGFGAFLFLHRSGDGFLGYIKVATSATIPQAEMITKSPI